MLKLKALILTAFWLSVEGQLLVPEEPNVLTPPYFNIASGKKIEATATCGAEEPHVFCKLTGGPNEFGYSENLYQGQFCDVCDLNDPTKAHPIQFAIDGTEKWWQSPPLSQGSEYNKINVTIHLGQVFHVAYVIIKFANSPRAGTWVLERSSDHGKTFQPWQYFANSDSDCHNLFGIDAFEEITQDNSVICTSEYSDVVPLERGEVIVSIINSRPGAKNFSHSPVLQEWSKATDVRLRLLRTKTLLGHLMAVQRQDPTVTRRYFYSIKDVSIGGRCVCNGHADTCVPDPFDKYKLKCQCRHNTCGDSCEYCCPGFVQKAWRAAVPESANDCEACNCHGHSTECIYDEQVAIRRQSLDLSGSYEGGGVCQNCAHNTAGINCERCVDGYYRPANVDPRDPDGCRPCDCDSAFTVGTCEPVTGRCYCQPKYAGDRCDRCAPGYHRFPDCEPCPCYYNATRDGVCLPVDDVCPCKYNFAGKYCSECAPGFYNFPECAPCACTGQGAISDICDVYTGQCECEQGFGGLYCDQCSPGYYKYPVCQSCSCYTQFTTAEVCDPETGACFCEDPVTGESCNQCKPGYYDFPNCRECECNMTGSANSLCDAITGKCQCKPNYQGPRCDECAPEYYGYPDCVPCDCHVQGSSRTTCDPVTGDCTCLTHITGRRCDQCAPDYFNFPRCEDCKCNPLGIKSVIPGVCLAFTTGQCDCKDNVIGKYCDMCAPLHYNLTLGCVDCNCFLQGTLDGVANCDSEQGECWCKPYTCSQRCSKCEDGFFGLKEKNYFGCEGCQCDSGGARTQECESVDGQCDCKEGVEGRQCDTVSEGYYYPNLLQYKFEVEYGNSGEDQILRFGFDENQFPEFSGTGYGEFSVVQREITIPVRVASYGLYKIVFYYIYPNRTTTANVTLTPIASDGSEQEFKVQFEPSAVPALHVSKDVFVLNEGKWNIVIEGDPGLLIDYIVLLPSEYYEPGKLQASIYEPCKPVLIPVDKECIMYDHPSLEDMAVAVMTTFTDKEQHDTPSTAHPTMVILNGDSLDDEHKTVSVSTSVDAPGKYVLVLEYASSEDRMQTVQATVSDGAGRVYEGAVFNIYACEYLFLCRQVALTPLSEVMVFDASVGTINVDLSVNPGDIVFVRKLHAIPYEQWTLEYVEPRRRCISKVGPEFDQCIVSAYSIPGTATVIDLVASEDIDDVPTATDPDTDVKFVGNGNNTIIIDMDLEPGRYVFLLHYFNPDHLSFSPDVVINGGKIHDGSANIVFCPSGDGCRSIVTADNGDIVLDITEPTQTVTITVPADKSLWLDYILAIPENAYDEALLDLKPIDRSRKFFDECYGVGSEGLVENVTTLPEFCKDAIFSLTMDFNDGALPCDCSGPGTVGGGDVDCEDFGGQCPCKPNVIGRQCDKCKTGYYGFPDCRPCDCNGALCDEINGNCICPPNTVEPGCDQCQPFTHSFHPLAGCVACNCHQDGVEDADDLGCSQENGQCRCKENVEGIRCDKCKPGFFGFPDCRPCVCDERGRHSEGCDSDSGQCVCKENVAGQQCDRCKAGTFHLDEANPLGCTACFCFGVSEECAGTQFPIKEIVDMEGWRLLNLKTPTPEVVLDGDTVSVDVIENGGPVDPTRAALYWAAPKTYLNDQMGSYGGDLRFVVNSERPSGGRGDSTANEAPAPLTAPSPTVVLEGQGMVIGWTNRGGRLTYPAEINLNLVERNFVHQDTGIQVKRPEMMMVLQQLSSLRIHASDYPDATYVTLSGVSLTTTDYEASRGSGETLPTVEACICPKGYTGRSCELCDIGHFRDERGPYLGFCAECDCYGHCDSCDDNGQPANRYDCKHHTAGDNCEKCEDGYIGDATTGDPEACQVCPCPFPNEDGNFADKCEYDGDGNVICFCKEGYTGEKCDQCMIGYFGNPSIIGGQCVECNCHGNLDPNLIMEVCDPATGECKDCQYNTGGKYCERCAEGYFGDAIIAKNCTKCPCDECGTLQCDHVLGFCACKAHVIGLNCDRCEPGFWNLDTCNGCQSCRCGAGSLNDECDASSGRCQCAPNVIGQKCDKCAPGHWDYSDMGCKPCNCRNNGDCNPVNGECKCPPGITGPQCDQCKLDRHILPPGGLECESCDTCTHDLLDTIEPMTNEVRDATDLLSEISVGVAAAQRLEDLEDRSDKAKEDLDKHEQHIEDTEYDADKLLNAEIDSINEILAGSGDEETSGEVPAPIVSSTKEQDSYIALKGAIGKIEEAVGAMCNKSDAVLEAAERTNGRMLRLDANTTSLVDDGEQFTIAAKELLQKLIDESSGDSEEYLQNLVKAEMLIARMKERIFKPMQDIADAELLEAEELFSLVNVNFTLPADDIRTRVEKVSQDLTDKLNKMKELRTRLNDATNAVTEVDTLNAANSKALLAARDAVDRIIVEWEIVNNLVKDSQVILDGDFPGDLVILGTEELNRETLRLQDEYDSMVAGLEGKKELVDQAKEKALMLQNDADELQRLVEETKNDPRNVRAVEAANRYQNIVNTIEKAREAASMADLDATEANKTVKEEKLEEAARVANDDSGKLLALVQDYQNNEVSRARDDLDGAKSTKNVLDESVTNLSNKLDAVDNGITNLNPGETNEKLQATRDKTKEANDLIAMVNEQAAALEESANNAPSPDIPLSDEIGAVEEILGNLEGDIDDVKGEIVSIKQKAARIKLLPRNLQLDDKIKEIRKRIELSRSRADSVGVSMEFKSKPLTKGVHPEYAQVYIPRQSFLLADSMEIDVYVNISKAGDNSLLYLGDQSTEDGDYVALETIGGRVYYYYKVGDGVGELRSNVAINDEEWHRVVIQRNGGNAMLTVHYMDPSPPRGDSLPSDLELTDVQTGTLDTDMLQASLGMADSAFIIGGNPLEPTPGRLQNKQMDGCITNVKVNGELVGIWDFISYNGPVPGRTCKASPPASTADPKCWRFRGIDSYLRVSQEQLVQLGQASSGTVVDYIFFKMLTNEKNGLLFLVGKDKSQFYALENRDDKFVLTYNFGWDEPKSATSPNNLPGLSTFEQYVNVKFAILRRRNPPSVYLIFNNSPVPVIQFTLPDTANVQGDVWFGGVHRNEGNEQFLPYVPNVNNNFRGCITQMKFHYLAQYYNVYEAKERLGVFPRCDLDMVPDIDPEVETGHVSVGKDVPYIGITDQQQDGDDGDGGGDGDDDTVTDEPVITTTTEEPFEEYRYGEEDEKELSRLIYVEEPDLDTVDVEDSRDNVGGRSAVAGDKNVNPGMTESKPVMKNDGKTGGVDSSDNAAVPEVKENIEIVNVENGNGGVVETDVVDVNLSKEKVDVEIEEVVISNPDVTEPNQPEEPLIVVVATNDTKVMPPKEDVGEIIEAPEIDLEEQAQVAKKGDERFAVEEEGSAASVLPAILIIMGVIVGVVLVAAVVSALMKGSLFAGSGGSAPPNPPVVPAEQAPLNDVQAQRVAQMDW